MLYSHFTDGEILTPFTAPIQRELSSPRCTGSRCESLVGLDKNSLKRGISYEYLSLDEFMLAHISNNSKHNEDTIPPFFFPKAKPSGPDMVFFIQVADNKFPVFVQLRLREALSKKDSNHAVSMDRLEDYCPAKTYVSMVVAYPAGLKDSTSFIPKEGSKERRDTLRFSKKDKKISLKQVLIRIDESNFKKIFPKSHVEFMDGIKTLGKRALGDDQEEEASGCSKKTKMKTESETE
ncbi:hypothetical protein BGX27_002463 [Mortierella sp. AM989]|nr:hypothetical protein BGX27_002463 [Mortierella sp. AM989]